MPPIHVAHTAFSIQPSSYKKVLRGNGSVSLPGKTLPCFSVTKIVYTAVSVCYNNLMYTLIKKIVLICAIGVCVLCCAGCSIFGDLTADGLLAAPHTAARFDGLYQQVDELIGSGAEYSSPTSGSNRQSIQFEDIDGDGLQEAVVFLRTADELPLMICLFRQSSSEDEPEYTPVGHCSTRGQFV